MKREQRIIRPGDVRVAASGRTVEAVVLTYGVIDDYNTMFAPGVFAESLQARMPRMVWSHSWDDPIGRWVDYRDTDTELTLIGELDDFEAVPRARQAAAQLASGTIDQFSVGFMREAEENVEPDEVEGVRGIVRILKGQLDEASLVLRGAVPGTRLLSVRSPQVAWDAAAEYAARIQAGEMTAEQAKAALDLLAVEDPGEGDEGEGGELPPAASEVDHAALDAEIDAALDRAALR